MPSLLLRVTETLLLLLPCSPFAAGDRIAGRLLRFQEFLAAGCQFELSRMVQRTLFLPSCEQNHSANTCRPFAHLRSRQLISVTLGRQDCRLLGIATKEKKQQQQQQQRLFSRTHADRNSNSNFAARCLMGLACLACSAWLALLLFTHQKKANQQAVTAVCV